MPKVWLVTGTSTGFGNDLIKIILDKGDYAVATARNSSSLSFSGANSNNYLAVDLDVTNQATIDAAFDAALKKFSRIDVVCNNAGYGLRGPFETLSDQQLRTQMEVNFFGLLAVTRKSLQVMREQKPSGGIIQQITSIGGQVGVPEFSLYCASKWAVEGFTEAVSKEIKPEWGIKLTCIEPGGFRTDWSGRSMHFGEVDVPAYSHLNPRESAATRHGKQVGDPYKGALAFYELGSMADPPLRCVVGTDAYGLLGTKLDQYKENREKYKDLSNSTEVQE